MLGLLAIAACAAASVTFPRVQDRLYTGVDPKDPPFALSSTLGDHMVLQMGTPSTVWGFAASGTTVKTLFAGNTYTTTAGTDTIWRQALPSQAANNVGQTISFSASTGETAELQDVLFGDVFICSGQGSAFRSHSPLSSFPPLTSSPTSSL